MTLTVTFAMTHTIRDAALAQKSSDVLKALYPDSPVLVIEDKPRLKLAASAGQWTERWMQAALGTRADIVVKLDPDTRAKRVATFPSSDVFGQVAPKGTYWPESDGILSGGAIGFQRAAVQKILDSGLLRDVDYRVKPYYYSEPRFGTPQVTIALNDPIVDDIARRLSLSRAHWDGLDLHYSWESARPFRADATFVHPVKD